MVARVLFPVLICGGTRSHPHHRATIKALPSSTQPPSPLRNPGSRLRLMPSGRPLRAPWKRLQYGWIVVCALPRPLHYARLLAGSPFGFCLHP